MDTSSWEMSDTLCGSCNDFQYIQIAIGQQHNAVGVERVQRAGYFGGGFFDVWHGDGGEESEPVAMLADDVGEGVVEVAG